MVCCFSSGILTRAEREAITRLREQRAQGHIPMAVTHRAVATERVDPFVTFYSAAAALPRARTQAQAPPRPRLPRPNHPPRPTLQLNNSSSSRPKVRRASPKRADAKPRPPSLPRPEFFRLAPTPAAAAARAGRGNDATAPSATSASVLGPREGSASSSGSASGSESLIIAKAVPSSKPDKSSKPMTLPKPSTSSKPVYRTAHQRKAAERRAARARGTGAHAPSSSGTPSRLLSAAFDALRVRGTDAASSSDSADGTKQPSVAASRSGRIVRDGAAAVVGVIRAIPTLRPEKEEGKEEECGDSGSDEEKENVRRFPKDRIAVSKGPWRGRRKLDDMLERLGYSKTDGVGHKTRNSERSDAAESSNDMYFQELMKGE